MAIEILSYKTSILNPLIKIISIVIFCIGTYYFYMARQKYGGQLKTIANLLFLGGLAGIASAISRIIGDYILFTKWGESVFFLIFGIVSLYVAYIVRDRFIEAAKALGLMGAD